ncbi:hypothetical protein PHLGIDRAFT_347806 [Phlebiopsis gigantea 11061_1 CR5-6]|uniref:Uncharacterized protein n=1 Tax=Phlebiopsis gigantea (strain 11061_1 CR5-6) TaxID=745531 RepID=A0A0C3PQ18_PHLG1|nr:hypothetical protein PHLGIDRAFT_347806 [Phlebiopsis gigantea 11061_1 CR5-6]
MFRPAIAPPCSSSAAPRTVVAAEDTVIASLGASDMASSSRPSCHALTLSATLSLCRGCGGRMGADSGTAIGTYSMLATSSASSWSSSISSIGGPSDQRT